MSHYLPVALDVAGRMCLVVGGGPIAARKAAALTEAGARVRVVAPSICAELRAMAGDRSLDLVLREFQPSDLDDAFVVMTATDVPAVNHAVAEAARERRVLVNSADDPQNCDFILPSLVRRGDIQIAVSTEGRSPALARHLRERIEALIPPEYGALADVLAIVRSDFRAAGQRASPEAWQVAIDAEALQLAATGQLDEAQEYIRAKLAQADEAVPPTLTLPRKGGGDRLPATPPPRDGRGDMLTSSSSALLDGGNTLAPSPLAGEGWDGGEGPPRGRIVLVGAGPGDPGLLTVAGQRAITEADVIVYDRLVNQSILSAAKPEARRVYVGKQRGHVALTQQEINDLLCREARAGKTVVRLKGGDPFVFGRGGEEALAGLGAGVPVTVIPGVSAATAVPASAGIPVTHRGLASTFTVLTGHEDPEKQSTLRWNALAQIGGTLVLLMGVETLPAVCAQLIEHGLDPSTPAAVIQCGTTETQRVVVGTAADIGARARAEGIEAPATTVIGQVARLELMMPSGPGSQLARRAGPDDGH